MITKWTASALVFCLLWQPALAQRPPTTGEPWMLDANGNLLPALKNGHVPNLPAGTTVGGAPIGAPLPVVSVRHDFASATTYTPTADTNAARGTKLLEAAAAAVAGEIIELGPGTYALTAQLILPDNVSLNGAGRDVTIITSTVVWEGVDNQFSCILPGDNSQITNLTIQGVAAAGFYQLPLGAGQSDTPFTGAVARNLRIIGDSDGIYLGTVTASTMKVYDTVIESKYDAVAVFGPGTVELFDSTITIAGPSLVSNWDGTCRALAVFASTSIIIYHEGSITVSGGVATGFGSGANQGAYGQSTARIEMFGTRLNVSGTNAFDLIRTNGSATKIAGVFRSDGAALVTSGTIGSLSRAITRDEAGIVAGTNITLTGTWPNQTINSAGGGGVSALPTGKQLRVDAVNGDDVTAAAASTGHDLTKPFLTLPAAKTSAVSGDTVIVGPGAYTVSGSIAKNGVNWDFDSGATVTSAAATPGIFDDGNTAMTFEVTGSGRFVIAHATDEGTYAIYLAHANSSAKIECDEIYGNALTLVYSNGSLALRARNIEGTGDTGGAIELVGSGINNIHADNIVSSDSGAVLISGGTNTIIFDSLTAPGSGTEGLGVSGGTTTVNGRLIDAGLGEAITLDGGTLSVFNAKLLTASTTGTVRLSGSAAGTVDLYGCVIQSTHTTMTPVNYASSPSNKTLILRNCEINAAVGATYGITSGNAQSVTIQGSLVTNKPVDGNITLAYTNTKAGGDGAAITGVVHTTGTESVGGAKTFAIGPIITDATASKPVFFNASKKIVPGVEGTDYWAIPDEGDSGDVLTSNGTGVAPTFQPPGGGGGYTDENAQDAVGGIFVDTATIDFTYTDATPSITASVIDASVTLAKMANMATDSFIGRDTASTGVPEVLSASTARGVLGLATSDTPTLTGLLLSGATASTVAGFDGTKNLVSLTATGTGNVVKATAPTLADVIFTGDNTFEEDTTFDNSITVGGEVDTAGLLLGGHSVSFSGSTFSFAGTLTANTSVTFPPSGTLLVSGGDIGTPSGGVATNLTGTAAGLTAGNVTTNANLTGAVTSTGNAAVLGSFTLSQLNTAVSDANVARTDAANTLTGNQTITGNIIQGNTTSASTATPLTINSGGTYANSATSTKAKWILYDDGDPANICGLGLSAGQFNFFTFATIAYKWYFSDVLKMTLTDTGLLTAVGGYVDGVQALSGAGAILVTTGATAFTSTGAAQALTLADGVAGQRKVISHVSDGGSGVLTPTTKSGYSTITFTNVGDAVTLQFYTTAGWIIIGQNGVTVTP